MNTGFMIMMVAFAAVSVCYGWGMRGSLMGGEKGAMLPGAVIAMLFVAFTKSEVIMQNWYFFAAAGLMGMTYGGTEPYGETIGMTVEVNNGHCYNKAKGYTGLMLKGALWFCIAGGFITMTLSALTGQVYSAADIIIFFVLLPFIQQLGVLVFNKPYNKEKGIFPKIYFSWDSREEWGGNVAVIVEMLVFALLRGDSTTAFEMLFGFVFGAIGWAVAIHFYDHIEHPNKKGRYYFHYLSSRKIAESWKTMEFTLGALGGAGLMLGFIFNRERIAALVSVIEANGGVYQFFPNGGTVFSAAAVACIVGIIIVNIVSEVKDLPYDHVLDLIERPFFCVIPLALVMLGSETAARIMTFTMLWLAAAIKCYFSRFKNFSHLKVWRAGLIVVTLAVFAGEFLRGYSFAETWFLCGLPYLIIDWLFFFTPAKVRKMKERVKSGESWAVVLGAPKIFFPIVIIVYHIIGFYIA